MLQLRTKYGGMSEATLTITCPNASAEDQARSLRVEGLPNCFDQVHFRLWLHELELGLRHFPFLFLGYQRFAVHDFLVDFHGVIADELFTGVSRLHCPR